MYSHPSPLLLPFVHPCLALPCTERKLFDYVNVEPSESSSSKTGPAAVPRHSPLQQDVSGEGDNLKETVEEAVAEGDETSEETPLLSWMPQHGSGEGAETGDGERGRVSVLELGEGREEVETVFDKVSFVAL